MTKKQADAIRNKIDYHSEKPYDRLTFDELRDYYHFALGGYICGKGKFVYADAQSQAKYIDLRLALAYLTKLMEVEGIEASQKEHSRMIACGYMYDAELNGVRVLCTSEGKQFVERGKKA